MSDDELEAEKMRFILSSIANEMQRLHNESIISNDSELCESEDIFNKFIKCKSSLRCKKEEVKKLKQNLQTACFIAKTVTSAKENETALLNNHLSYARNQYLELVQQRKDESDLINKLTTENQNLRDKLEYFDRCVDLGYKELQKMRNEPVENVPSLQQLKKIILCCGQYYADYSNEHDKCLRLEHKNRFLNNKLRILECYSALAPNYHTNFKIDVKNKGTSLRRSEAKKPRDCVNIGIVCSEYQLSKTQNKLSNVTMTKIHSIETKTKDLDISTHFEMVKKLLDDQDNLLIELKSLSNEINNLNSESADV